MGALSSLFDNDRVEVYSRRFVLRFNTSDPTRPATVRLSSSSLPSRLARPIHQEVLWYLPFGNRCQCLPKVSFTTIHPIPPYDNLTIFEQVINRTVELGLYLIFDMPYQNMMAIVDTYKSLPNLLIWETVHEPDGNSDPFNAAQNTYDLIYQMDGYHPVSTVLDCENYILLFAASLSPVFSGCLPTLYQCHVSPVWHTPCTRDFGHCGCDDCEGGMIVIRMRIQTYNEMLGLLGYDRSKTVWTTPHAIGRGAYWNSTPTGLQWAAMDLISFNHRAMGSMSFHYPTNSTVLDHTIRPFLVNLDATYATYDCNGVDAGLWCNGTAYLLLVASLNADMDMNGTAAVVVPWSAVGLGTAVTTATQQVQRVFAVAQNVSASGVEVMSGGIGVYTVTPPAS
ncbi:hypothetical protein SCLCIDRAFT_25538 [Scleroderma citrinum Foug A]|uniref:Glycoside hydrolase family 5 protein n=1 Tax=Scleroderma citrinum Foug A TaxID=1036808 RepID=A0A0C3AAE6_9AGAM|nr:hypothetical protein SCLCIDRAFT_25538 [Scleroderma citrinum Foug A]